MVKVEDLVGMAQADKAQAQERIAGSFHGFSPVSFVGWTDIMMHSSETSHTCKPNVRIHI